MSDEEYVEAWRKPMPEPFNKHLSQLQPRTAKRPAALDERIAQHKAIVKHRSNLIR